MLTILFDVDGVLIHGYHTKPELQHCWDEDLTADFGIDREAFKSQFIFGPFVEQVLIGQRDLADALAECLPRLGYHGPVQDLIDYWMVRDAQVNQPLLEQVKRLAAYPDVRLCVATNQEHVRARYLMEQVGFNRYFADIFYAARLGALKPDPLFFQRVEALNPVPRDQVIFFDDSQAVV
ncbi:MAG: HAD family hydrolase, partial [Pseudomonadota bacterium]